MFGIKRKSNIQKHQECILFITENSDDDDRDMTMTDHRQQGSCLMQSKVEQLVKYTFTFFIRGNLTTTKSKVNFSLLKAAVPFPQGFMQRDVLL